MQCPIDNTQLVMSERQGIEIDYCPKCRGVWLDRGELDKIIERSVSEPTAQAPARSEPPRKRDDRDHDDRHRDDRYRDDHGRPYKKRKSFLDDIFDF